MSDDESFVILGSSSIENDGVYNDGSHSQRSSLDADTPANHFASLSNSEIIALQNAQEKNESQPSAEDNNLESKYMVKYLERERDYIAGSKLWSRQPQLEVKENIPPLSLEDCALKSPLEQQQIKSTESVKQTQESVTIGDKAYSAVNGKTTPASSVESNLATSFIMGEVNAEVLKTSVFSQFPSISTEACAEDVDKLQNMVAEYMQLKTTIKKANTTMKLFYTNSMQCRDKMQTMEEQFKQQLGNCQQEIEVLRKQNQELEFSFKGQIQALEIALKNDSKEVMQEMSEKNALLENLRDQIIKLEQQQLASFEFVAQKNQDEQNSKMFEKYYITRREHEHTIKNLERQLSEMLASNLDLKDVEKQYIDELNCLRVNLTAAEELIMKHRGEIDQLNVRDTEKQQQIQVLQKSLGELHLTNAEQTERITLLEHQNELHRKDFEMEQESRQTALKEKQQILQDLRSLQRKNQELIEEHSKMVQSYESRQLPSSANAAGNNTPITIAAAAAQSHFNNPQRPNTALPSSPVLMQLCPICNKAFKSLNILQSHVNDCIDKN